MVGHVRRDVCVYVMCVTAQEESGKVLALIESLGGLDAVMHEPAKMSQVVRGLSVGTQMTLSKVRDLGRRGGRGAR